MMQAIYIALHKFLSEVLSPRRAAILASLLLPFASLAGPSDTIPTVTINGTSVTVIYDWSRERCEEWDIPDAPLRAFRDAQGGVVGFVSDSKSRRFTGGSLLTIRHSCQSSFLSQQNPDPAAYAGLDYVTATWTGDGTHVAALLHNEYHAEQVQGACKYQKAMQCWYNTVIGAHSVDGGQSFQTANPPPVMAALPFRQDYDQGRHRGFFNPSNIVFRNGFFYVASNTTGGLGQDPGLCVFRTQMVDDASSWRGYDGQGFTARAIDPYRVEQGYVPCRPVRGGTVGSISWHAASQQFLIVGQGGDRQHPNGETTYAWSHDLIHWSAQQTLFSGPDMSSKDCGDQYRYGYPSILDADAPGRNFDQIGEHPYLFLTRFQVKDCHLTANRDLVRLPLDVDSP